LSETNFNRALEMIERNAQAQVQMVQDLLDVSQIVAGRLRLARKVVDPLPLVESAVDSVRSLAESKTIALVSKLAPITGELEADPDRLKQVVWNLLSNAVKFTPPGGKVEVAMYGVNGNVHITVTDTGVGIAPEVLPYIFDRFGQADDPNAKLRSGLGLGLAIVRHVLDLHGGTVVASSPGAGGGATFMLQFPLQARKVAAATS
jgi:signal transduction histidine kinase